MPRTRPDRRLWLSLCLLAVAATLVLSGLPRGPLGTGATFASTSGVAANTFDSATLAPPTNLQVATGAGAATLTWDATPSAWADGYKVYRSASADGPWTEVGQVTGRATVTWTDPGPVTGTVYYVVRAYRVNWLSGTTETGQATDTIEVSQTFPYTGADQTWVVPAGVTTVTVEAWGAQGGSQYRLSDGYPNTPSGGRGGYAKGTVPVTPGETLTVVVGGRGQDGSENGTTALGGYGGGGAGGAYTASGTYVGGGGGGRSEVARGPGSLIVAGGGGGAASSAGMIGNRGGGAGGGLTGGNGAGSASDADGGKGGTQTGGGAGGTGPVGTGQPGARGTGGNGASGYSGAANSRSGGGGGGGYYGGGGGGTSGSPGNSGDGGAGGAGSGYVGDATDSTLTADVRTGHGQVVLTYRREVGVVDVPAFLLKGTSTSTPFDDRAGAPGLDYTQDGTVWAIGTNYEGSTAVQHLYYSKDSGQTWVKSTAVPPSVRFASFTPGRFVIDKSDRFHLVQPGQGTGRYVSGVPNAGRTAVTWQVDQNAPYPDSDPTRYGNDLAVVAFPRPANPSQTDVFWVWTQGASSGGSVQGRIWKGVLASDGTWATAPVEWGLATFTRPTQNFGRMPFGVTFRHTGDGKTPAASPDIMVVGVTYATGNPVQSFLFPYSDTPHSARATAQVTFAGTPPYVSNEPSVLWDPTATGGGRWFFAGRRASPSGGQMYLGYVNTDGTAGGVLSDPPATGAPGYDSAGPNALIPLGTAGDFIVFAGEQLDNQNRRWKYARYSRGDDVWGGYTVLEDNAYYLGAAAGAIDNVGTVGFTYTTRSDVEATVSDQQEVWFRATR